MIIGSGHRLTKFENISEVSLAIADNDIKRVTQILESLNWIPIEDTLKKRETIMTFKALTNRLPDYVQNFFQKSENSKYSLRSNNFKL